ncbi:MAG: hypothetical protein OJF51_003850 [Nitrospira sp.]|jgi:hypothetical protein|nr:MAG: hypothetical protein OJF51_003850 [Nitrospira sp.]
MSNQRSVDKAALQMIVQRSFDAHQATEKSIKPITNYDIKYRMGQDAEENGDS